MWSGDDVVDLAAGEWRRPWRLRVCEVETTLETWWLGTGDDVETWQMWSADDVGDLAAGEWR